MEAMKDIDKNLLSPMKEKKMALDAAKRKAEAPMDALKAKQAQSKAFFDASRQKADAAKKLYEQKQMLHDKDRMSMNNVMGKARSKADKAKNSVEERQRDYQNNMDLVKSLIEKIEKEAKGKK
jgi:hypothetical protein